MEPEGLEVLPMQHAYAGESMCFGKHTFRPMSFPHVLAAWVVSWLDDCRINSAESLCAHMVQAAAAKTTMGSS